MIDVSTMTDRDILEALFNGLINKARLGENAANDGAPKRPVPVDGFEKVFGPKPAGGTQAYKDWISAVPKVTSVETAIPEELVDGVLEFVAETKVKPVFVEYNGTWLAAVSFGPKPWLVNLERFQGSNVQGLIRVVKDTPK